MISLLWLLLTILASPFKSKYQLEAENVALRHQVVVLRHRGRGRVRLTNVNAAPVQLQRGRAWLRRFFCMTRADSSYPHFCDSIAHTNSKCAADSQNEGLWNAPDASLGGLHHHYVRLRNPIDINEALAVFVSGHC